MKNKITFKILLLVSITLALAASAFVGAYLLNNKWEKENVKWFAMKEKIVEDNSLVKEVYRIDSGPHCDIVIVLNSSTDFYQIETIYKSVLTQLCDEEIRQELKTHHIVHESGELAFLEIDFRDLDDEIFLYRFTASKKDGFEKWIVDDSIDPVKENLEYNMSDYATKKAE